MDEEKKNVQPETTQPEGNGAELGKTFTQEDVNRIVSERLARERDKYVIEHPKDPMEEREKNLQARESRIDCHDYVNEKGYNKAILDILDTSNVERFKQQIDKLAELFPDISIEKAGKTPVFSGATPVFSRGTNGGFINDSIADMFRHK